MEDFWSHKHVSFYILRELFDVDEIVRCFGGCPHDEDYKIERIYYYVEFQGADDYEIIYVSEDEYRLYMKLEDENYRTDLNYPDFLNKFWFNEFCHFIGDTIIPDAMFEFLNLANRKIFDAENESKSKIILTEILTTLINITQDLEYISPHIKKNRIQKFVILEYKNSYLEAINRLLSKYALVFPKIIEEFQNKIGQPNTSKKESKKAKIPLNIELPQHNHIFKNNSFTVWEYLREKLNIKNSSRADVKFAYEEMKKDGLIHKTVNQTSFLQWVNETYQFTIEKTSHHVRDKQRLDRYQEAKELYKEDEGS